LPPQAAKPTTIGRDKRVAAGGKAYHHRRG